MKNVEGIRDMIPKFMEEATAKDGDLDMDKFRDRLAKAIQSYYENLLPKKREEKGYISSNPEWHEDKGYNQAISEMLSKIKGDVK